MTDEQANEKEMALQAFGALLSNAAWRTEILPRIQKAHVDAADGCAARGKTPEQRAEFIEAFHLTAELLTLPETRIKRLREELAEFARARHGSGSL